MLSPIVLYYLSYCLSYFRVFFLEICYLDFSGGKGGIHVWYPFVKSEKKNHFFYQLLLINLNLVLFVNMYFSEKAVLKWN